MPVETMTRIARLFETARERNRKPFIAYLTAGDPDLSKTASLVTGA